MLIHLHLNLIPLLSKDILRDREPRIFKGGESVWNQNLGRMNQIPMLSVLCPMEQVQPKGEKENPILGLTISLIFL